MANENPTRSAVETAALWERKISLLREVLATTREELLLVELDGLTPLLERKEVFISEIARVDEALAAATNAGPPEVEEAGQRDVGEVVAAILENERALEERMEREYTRLKKELRDFDRQTTLRRYLERGGATVGKVDLKK